MQHLLVDGVHRLVVAAAILHHPRVLPRPLAAQRTTHQKSKTDSPHTRNKFSHGHRSHPPTTATGERTHGAAAVSATRGRGGRREAARADGDGEERHEQRPHPRGRRPPTPLPALASRRSRRGGGGGGRGGAVRRGSGLLRRHPASALEWKVLEARSGRLGNETKGNEPQKKLSPRVARVRWNLWRQMGGGGGGLITRVDLCVTATWGTWVCERCLTLMTRLLFWQAILLGVQPWSPGRQHASTNNFLSKMLHD